VCYRRIRHRYASHIVPLVEQRAQDSYWIIARLDDLKSVARVVERYGHGEHVAIQPDPGGDTFYLLAHPFPPRSQWTATQVGPSQAADLLREWFGRLRQRDPFEAKGIRRIRAGRAWTPPEDETSGQWEPRASLTRAQGRKLIGSLATVGIQVQPWSDIPDGSPGSLIEGNSFSLHGLTPAERFAFFERLREGDVSPPRVSRPADAGEQAGVTSP
jgi:hypothetical protein